MELTALLIIKGYSKVQITLPFMQTNWLTNL